MIVTTAVIAAGLFLGGPVDNDLTCESAVLIENPTGQEGRWLTNGDHINMEIVVQGRKFQVNAFVDQNIQGGWNPRGGSMGYGLRINDHQGQQHNVPLTEEQVKSGLLKFDYPQYVGADGWTVEWVQFNDSYFNQDRDEEKFLDCNKPKQPKPKEWVEETVVCDSETWTGVVKYVKYRTEWTFDRDTWTWVESEPIEVKRWEKPYDGADCLPTCEDLTQEEAQELFESDPAKYDYLDPDGDGRACELPDTGADLNMFLLAGMGLLTVGGGAVMTASALKRRKSESA